MSLQQPATVNNVDVDIENSPLVKQCTNGSTPLAMVPCEEVSLLRKLVRAGRQNALLILTLLGVLAGFALGFGVRPAEPSESALMWIGLPGEMYMRMLKMTILPLIVSSVIAGSSSMDSRSNGKVSMLSLAYVLLTNVCGVILGLALFFIFKPGGDGSVTSGTDTDKSTQLQTQDIFADMIRNLLPDNVITACFQKTQTHYEPQRSIIVVNGTEILEETHNRRVGSAPGTNVIGLIIVCTLVGMASAQLGEVGKPFIQFFKGTSEIIITVLRWLIWFTPVGVASLICKAVAAAANLENTMRSLGIFVLAIITGISLLVVLICPLVYFIFVRKNPAAFLYSTLRPFMTAFATASSAVAIPEVLTTCEAKHGVDSRISRFFVPFAIALNRTGSCIFITCAALLLCRLEAIELGGPQVLSIAVLSAVSSLAIPAVPSGSIICILIILSSVRVQATHVGLLMALEWITDRLRTGANIVSITLGAIVVHLLCSKSLSRRYDVNGGAELSSGADDGNST